MLHLHAGDLTTLIILHQWSYHFGSWNCEIIFWYPDMLGCKSHQKSNITLTFAVCTSASVRTQYYTFYDGESTIRWKFRSGPAILLNAVTVDHKIVSTIEIAQWDDKTFARHHHNAHKTEHMLWFIADFHAVTWFFTQLESVKHKSHSFR